MNPNMDPEIRGSEEVLEAILLKNAKNKSDNYLLHFSYVDHPRKSAK